LFQAAVAAAMMAVVAVVAVVFCIIKIGMSLLVQLQQL
jgi:preprotein translocase subunit SecG